MKLSKFYLLLFVTLFFFSCEKDKPILLEADTRISESSMSDPVINQEDRKAEPCGFQNNQTLACSEHICGRWRGVGYHSYNPVPLVIPGEVECEITLAINQLDVPNRFTVYNSNGVEVSSGWIGFADYPGPWGTTLNNDNPGLEYLTFTSDPNESYTLVVETVISQKGTYKFGADSWEVYMDCECNVVVCEDDCGGSINGYNGEIGYQVYINNIDLQCLDQGCTVSLRINPYDVPNRFYVYTPTGQQLLSTPWLGESMNPGPWGTTPDPNNGYYIYNPGEFEYSITKGPEDYWVLRTETVVSPNTTDNWWVEVVCDCDGGGSARGESDSKD